MDSKVLLITGGAKRIGAEIAKKFHDEGFNVILSFQSSSAEATEVASKLNKLRKNSAVAKKINLAELDSLDLFFSEYSVPYTISFSLIGLFLNFGKLKWIQRSFLEQIIQEKPKPYDCKISGHKFFDKNTILNYLTKTLII